MTAATRFSVALVIGFGLFGSPGQVRAGEPDRVGQILIVGNVQTPAGDILVHIGFWPGQILQYPQLEAARKRLAQLSLFDPDNPPSVDVLPNELDNRFKDILIRVNERPGAWVQLAVRNGNLAVQTADCRLMGDVLLQSAWHLREHYTRNR